MEVLTHWNGGKRMKGNFQIWLVWLDPICAFLPQALIAKDYLMLAVISIIEEPVSPRIRQKCWFFLIRQFPKLENIDTD
jgi:hypothetical protein